jgi:glutamate dehydrogenase
VRGEIYVQHAEMEGVHLRAGPIARGGVRFSDRADFRVETLRLLATQAVKNVGIVPQGARGSFYCTSRIDDPAERRRRGDALYGWYVRGLLDLTDNYVDGAPSRPPRVVTHDAFDPYLVVAPDHGTEHLSDAANAIAAAYGHWLGDAFASSGSDGYDHRAMGSTARGAWVLVHRHFRELGMDVDAQSFSCVGIGDCAGEVFGAGVTLSPNMRLLGAFSDTHLLLDPDPDPRVALAERERLCREQRGWAAYHPGCLGPGGGVFDRRARSVALSPQARAMLGTLAEELPPNEVVRLLLKMHVDLLWSGGTGTFVRGSHESNADVNDPTNDAVRVSAPELRCAVIGEGGHHGLTQAARVEYALAGGRVNADFVDNAAGVDTSDHEVNLKILLNPLVADGRLSREGRDELLRSLADDVTRAVLEGRNATGRLLSLDVVRSRREPYTTAHAMDWLCARGGASRAALGLPSDDDLKRRAEARIGLTRPELAVVQAHVKLLVRGMLADEDPTVLPGFAHLVADWFPRAVRERHAEHLPRHMLAREIGMTRAVERVLTDAGVAFFPLVTEITGASAERVAGGWLAAMELIDGEALKADLSAARARPDVAYYAWTTVTDALTELVTLWSAPGHRDALAEDRARFDAALSAIVATRSAADAAAARAIVEAHASKGIPERTAERIADAANCALASMVCAVADARGEPVVDAARRTQAIGHATRLLPVLRGIAQRRAGGRWDPVALGVLRLRYHALLRDLATYTHIGPELALGVDQAAAALAAGPLGAAARVVDHVVGEGFDIPALLVAEQQVRAALAAPDAA